MKESTIGWTDYSGGDLNFVTGCTAVSEGCERCYARAIYKRWGRDFDTVKVHENKLARLARAKFPEYSLKRGEGHRPMAFVCDTGDLFHADVPDAFIRDALDLMAYRSDVIWQVLTKRAQRMHDFINDFATGEGFKMPGNVWLGVTAENQQRADERIPLLIDTPAAVRFVSVEPMLTWVNLRPWLWRYESWKEEIGYLSREEARDAGNPDLEGEPVWDEREEWIPDGRLSWVICGSESGPNRRRFDLSGAGALYQGCHDAGIPFFGKQDSDVRPGKPLLLWGETVHEWPRVPVARLA